jgi:TrpR-related protein YerC/YecD
MSVKNERKKRMKSTVREENLEFLFKGILTLESVEECYHFFEDLCTVSELQEMARRMQAAKLLKDNFIYTEIAARTGLSTATISRVNRCLKYGTEGYVSVLDKLDKQERRGR